jgi:fatty acyl-CoA reductase
VRQDQPEQLKKIKLVKGDIIEHNLDINADDESELIENIHILFHCAAKAKFSLTMRDALNFNTQGTLRVLRLAEKMKNLVVFSHFSTTYCNPSEKVMEERYYPPNVDPYEIIRLLNSDNPQDLDNIEPL